MQYGGRETFVSAVEDVKPHLTPEGKFALLLMGSEFLVFILFLIFDEPRMGLSPVYPLQC